MQEQNSPSHIYSQNLRKYELGQLDKLCCCHCFADTVSVYFDGPRLFRGEYWTRVYFFCSACKKWERITFPGIPPYFDESRDITKAARD